MVEYKEKLIVILEYLIEESSIICFYFIFEIDYLSNEFNNFDYW